MALDLSYIPPHLKAVNSAILKKNGIIYGDGYNSDGLAMYVKSKNKDGLIPLSRVVCKADFGGGGGPGPSKKPKPLFLETITAARSANAPGSIFAHFNTLYKQQNDVWHSIIYLDYISGTSGTAFSGRYQMKFTMQ